MKNSKIRILCVSLIAFFNIILTVNAELETREKLLQQIEENLSEKLIEKSIIGSEEKFEVSKSSIDPYNFFIRIIKNCDIKSNLGSENSSGVYLFKPFPRVNGIVLTFGIYSDKIMAMPNAQSLKVNDKQYWIGYSLALGENFQSQQTEINNELKKCVELVMNTIE